MPMTAYTGDTTIIADLGTNPEERGLTTDQFKAKFDEGLTAFVTWFNATHMVELETPPTMYDVTFINSLVVITDSLNKYWKNRFNEVTLTIYCKKSGTSDDIANTTQLCTLPVGYRPAEKVVCAIKEATFTGTLVPADVNIFTDGRVVITNATGVACCFVTLQVRFIAA